MHLVIDLANQIILPYLKNESLDSWLWRITKRIRFVESFARMSKLKPIFVCDVGYTTEEVRVKWKSRREREMERSIRKIPYCADIMVCELILGRKLDLVFDHRYNADDIVATIANMHPCNLILSRDMDYFRYDDYIFKNRVYFIGEDRKVKKLEMNGLARKSLQTIRMYFPIFASSHVDFVKLVKHGLYMRGTAYPFGEKKTGVSLHSIALPFRRMLYTGDVREIYPLWKQAKVAWSDTIVSPSSDPFPSSVDSLAQAFYNLHGEFVDENHLLTANLMVCEMFSARAQTPFLFEYQNIMRFKQPCVGNYFKYELSS